MARDLQLPGAMVRQYNQDKDCPLLEAQSHMNLSE